MTVTASLIGQSPFHPITDFRQFATDPTARVQLKEPIMFDLQLAIDKSGKLHDSLVMAKGAIVAGGDPAPIIADALTRLPEVANAMGHFADPIEDAAPADIEDDAAMTAVEGERIAAE